MQIIPIKTRLIMPGDSLTKMIEEDVLKKSEKGDLITIAESVVSVTQNRCYKIKDIKPRKLAKFLTRYVTKSPFGIGLAMPETMELALRDVGVIRILFAAFISAITKLFGLKGMFYRIAGRKAKQIDGPCDYTIPPFDEYATLGPKDPDKVCEDLNKKFDHGFAIVDANDIGIDVLGMYGTDLKKKEIEKTLENNPYGQSDEQTPIVILRPN